jgi:hypothetical protein
MDNIFEKIDTESSEDESSSSDGSSDSNSNSNSNLTEAFPNHFLNMTKKEDYLVNRNKLFTPDLLTKYLVINKTTLENQNQFTINFDSDLGINPMKNVIGFKLRKAFSKYSVSSYLTLDIIIDEIPHEACKVSNIESETHIIDRIPVSGSSGTLFHYQPQHSLDNYFFPISLDKLSFTIKPWNTGNAYTTFTSDEVFHLFFEFEITIVNNTELLK